MNAFALLLLLLPLAPAQDEAEGLRSEVNRLKGEVALLQGALKERDALLSRVSEELVGAREDLKELKDRPQPVAAPFLAAPPPSSDKLGVAKTAVLAPRVEVDSFLRHDTVVLKLRRVEAGAVRTVAELELTPDAAGVDLPLDQSGALYLVEWSTSEGHISTSCCATGRAASSRRRSP